MHSLAETSAGMPGVHCGSFMSVWLCDPFGTHDAKEARQGRDMPLGERHEGVYMSCLRAAGQS